MLLSPRDVTQIRAGWLELRQATGLADNTTLGLACLWAGRIGRTPLSWRRQASFGQLMGGDVETKRATQR